MLQITNELLSHLELPADQRIYPLMQAMVNSILECGNKEDACLLLDAYLEEPFDFDHNLLLPLFRKFGDTGFAERIYHTFVTGQTLHPDADTEVLEVLGSLKFEPAKELLYRYGFAEAGADYYLQKGAHLGLLHFDCGEYLEEIAEGISKCFNKNLFPEFLPALVCKLPDRAMYLERLYGLGDRHASTDCNAGLLLGFSHCGEEGRLWFMKAIFNPNWEAWLGSTGTLGFTYLGLKNLKISFSELYSRIKSSRTDQELDYGLRLLFSLFEMRVRDYGGKDMDSFRSLFLTFYSGPEATDFCERCGKAGKLEELSKFETLFEMMMTEEMMRDYNSVRRERR